MLCPFDTVTWVVVPSAVLLLANVAGFIPAEETVVHIGFALFERTVRTGVNVQAERSFRHGLIVLGFLLQAMPPSIVQNHLLPPAVLWGMRYRVAAAVLPPQVRHNHE